MDDNITTYQEQQFIEIIDIIQQYRSYASRTVNEAILFTAWQVGKYVSDKIKCKEWGSKVVNQLSEFIRSHYPDIKGFSRSNIYNMVMLYNEYSSDAFLTTVKTYLSHSTMHDTTQLPPNNLTETVMQSAGREIVQIASGQFIDILKLTTLSNHYEILNRCHDNEERLFYILYANKYQLKHQELRRCISNHTYTSLLGNNKNLSKGMLQTYPQSPVIFKDKLYLDFLGLPQKHSETRLKSGIMNHMKQFILELGKDFLFVDQEYRLSVGVSTFKADLLFFHRGLQALVAVELKKTKFHPKDLGQLEFYLEALDRDVKRSNENPSIGIILCPESDRMVVEYALSRSMSPTMVAEYKRILMPQEQMQKLLDEFCSLYVKDKDEFQK